MDFETALRAQILAEPGRKRRAKKLLAVMDEPASPRRSRIMERLKAHAIAHLAQEGIDASGVGFDWSSVDWSSLFQGLIKILLLLLPLFL